MLPTAAPVTTNRCVREGHPEQRAYGKIFKVSSFDAGMKKQISEAIDRLTSKWCLTQVTLARKERSE